MTLCKLFASELLEVPWMLHLDVFRPALDVQLASRSRPDLIGQRANGDWVAFECKGRISEPGTGVKTRAKQQATRAGCGSCCPQISCSAISYFKNDIMRFYWCDPEREVDNPIIVQPTPESWAVYDRPALELVKRDPDAFAQMLMEPTFVHIEEADVAIGINPKVLLLLDSEDWEEARRVARHQAAGGDYHLDGIAVKAGPSWLSRRSRF